MNETRDQTLIRVATEADLPAVLHLYSQLGMDDGMALTLETAKEIFNRMKAYPDYMLYVAVEGEAVVGVFALLIMDNLGHKGAPSGVVEDVVVHEDWRGKGVGLTMMDEAMKLCAAKGCYKLALTTNKSRHRTCLFYETLGFDLHGFSYSVPTRTIDCSSKPENEVESGAMV